MNSGDHRGLRDRRDDAILHRRCRRYASRMTIHATFAEELARLQNCDDRFLALLGQDSQLDPSFLNVKYRVGDVALLEHALIFMEFQYLLPRAHFGEKSLRVKQITGCLSHWTLLWPRPARSSLIGYATVIAYA